MLHQPHTLFNAAHIRFCGQPCLFTTSDSIGCRGVMRQVRVYLYSSGACEDRNPHKSNVTFLLLSSDSLYES
jgi:hypothetical protein